MTLAEAKKLVTGQIIYMKTAFNKDGTQIRWKVNGQVKTWKTMKNRVKVPLKYGLYEHWLFN